MTWAAQITVPCPRTPAVPRLRQWPSDTLWRALGGSREPLPVPIANCYLTGDPTAADPDRIVLAWAECAGVPPDEMTVNLISVRQGGKGHAAMAWLYLPSLWSEEDVVTLGEGLAAALATTLDVEPNAIQVLTTVVTSGSVIEAGKALRW